MEHDEFIAGYRKGIIRFGINATEIRKVVDNDLYQHLFRKYGYPRMLNRLSTIFSLLIIPSLIAALILPLLTVWWTFIPCAGITWLFQHMTYRYQREAVRQLGLTDPMAYKFLLLEGIIVVDESLSGS
jgi:hypothetical protein